MPRRKNEPATFENFPVDAENDPIEYDPSEASAEFENESVDLRPFDPVEVTPPPPLLGNFGNEPQVQVLGRPSSPKIWKSAQVHPHVTQLRVWRVINGNRVLIGPIDAQASEEDFIRYFIRDMPNPGDPPAQFVIRPIDSTGTEIGREITLPSISPTNVTLIEARRQLAQAQVVADANSSGQRSGSALQVDPILDVYKQAMADQRATMEMQRQALEAERRALLEERERIAQDRSDLASRSVMTVESALTRASAAESEAHQRLMQEQEAIARRSLEQQQGTMQSALTMQQNFLASVLAQQQASADRDRRDAVERRERDAREAEEQRRRDREDYERRHKEAQERHDHILAIEREAREAREKRESEERAHREQQYKEERNAREAREAREREAERAAAAEREDARKREHDIRLRQMELEAERAREHAKALHELERTKLETVGKNPDTVTGLLSTVTGVLAAVGLKPGDVIQKLIGGGESISPELIELGASTVGTIVSTIGDVVKTNIRAKAETRIAESSYSSAPVPPALPVPEPTALVRLEEKPEVHTEEPVGQEPQVPKSVLPLATLKSVRKLMREFMQAVRTQPEANWTSALALAVQQEGNIFTYVREKTMTEVLREAGADDTLIGKIIDTLRKSNMLPDDLPLS